MDITIKRVSEIEDGTFGVVLADDVPFALSLERRWLNNKKGESCIPAGQYLCKRVISPRFGETFEVTNVLNRTHILFHKGNLDNDSHGCIIIGEEFGILYGKNAILSSRKGFSEFKNRLKKVNNFWLVITPLF